MPVGVFLTSSNGEEVYTNPKAEDIFGFNNDELLGRSIDNPIPEKYRKSHRKNREDYMVFPASSAMNCGRILTGFKKSKKFCFKLD